MGKERTQRAIAVPLQMVSQGLWLSVPGKAPGPPVFLTPHGCPSKVSPQTLGSRRTLGCVEAFLRAEAVSAPRRLEWPYKKGALCVLQPGLYTGVGPPPFTGPAMLDPTLCRGRCPWSPQMAGGGEMASVSSSLPIAPAPPVRLVFSPEAHVYPAHFLSSRGSSLGGGVPWKS